MNAVLLILGTVFSTGLALMVWSLRHAPCGYQDLSGFNFGPEPTLATPQATTATASDLTAKPALAAVSTLQAQDTKTIRFNVSIPGQPEKKSLHQAA